MNIIITEWSDITMQENKYDVSNKRRIVGLTITIFSAILSAIFAVAFIRRAEYEFFHKYQTALEIASVTVIAITACLTIIFSLLKKDFLYKLGFICLVFLAIFSSGMYLLAYTGFLKKIKSVEDLREFIASYGALSVALFLLIQILQVVVLPIPGVIAIGAGVLLFGPFWGAVLSLIGITAGSFIAFFIGRKLGYKVVKWLVGKENLDKGLELVKGKDKIILTFMFLFPFFPDDVLCFVSGLSSMSVKFFTIMILITRTVSTFTTAYSVNGSLIPYNTWWGLLIWAVLIVATYLLVRFVYKNSGKIEKFFKRRKKS